MSEEEERGRVREGGKTSNNNTGVGQREQAGAKSRQRIWNMDSREWGQCGTLVQTQTHTLAQIHIDQMGLQGLKQGYSSSLSPAQIRQI